MQIKEKIQTERGAAHVHTRTVNPAALRADSGINIHELPQEIQRWNSWYASDVVVCGILMVADGRQLVLLCEMLHVLLQLQLLLRIELLCLTSEICCGRDAFQKVLESCLRVRPGEACRPKLVQTPNYVLDADLPVHTRAGTELKLKMER